MSRRSKETQDWTINWDTFSKREFDYWKRKQSTFVELNQVLITQKFSIKAIPNLDFEVKVIVP